MKTYPNWVDLIVVILLLRACYNGFGRGVLAEILNLVGAVSVTSLAINYWSPAARLLRPWLWVNAALADFLVFSGLFLILLLLVHLVVRRVTEVVKWERLHWAIQGLGLILGGLRGLWWSGVILVVLTSSGVTYLRASVEERSVVGPRLVNVSRESLERIADQFPGANRRPAKVLVPPMTSSATGTATSGSHRRDADAVQGR